MRSFAQSPLAEAAERERRRREAAAARSQPKAEAKPKPTPSPLPSISGRDGADSAAARPSALSIIYTGRSLGALGALRSQDEHELLTEQANRQGLPFKLVSHASWRAPGLSIFLPSDEPDGDELPRLLALRAGAERLGDVAALRSANALLIQDPDKAADARDLLALLKENPRTVADFPDLRPARASVFRANLTKKKVAYFVEEPGVPFITDPALWDVGEMNRIDAGNGRVFELPLNLAQIGPRATLVKRFVADAKSRRAVPIVVDLGAQNGDMGVDDLQRARIDMAALRRLGYEIVVPFEFELGLGAAALSQVTKAEGGFTILAANVTSKTPGLLAPTRVVEAGGLRFGLVGLVDPAVKGTLSRRVLGDWTFEDPVAAASREVQKLRLAGVDAVFALSNLSPALNADISRRVTGIDALIADLHVRWSPETLRTRVDLPDRPYSRPGSPALVARGFANGLGVGRVDAETARDDRPGVHVSALRHELASVTDRVPGDMSLTAEVRSMRDAVKGERGEMLVPSFIELEAALPSLRSYDATTAQGRISKGMWEDFMARLLRRHGLAEIAIIRTLSHFPPLIGKLHEDEVREWLWTDESVVTVDLRGADLRQVLSEDTGGELVLSGFDRKTGLINGRPLDGGALYRVATTDLLFEGARFRAFERGRRPRRTFRPGRTGLVASSAGGAVLLRDLVLDELRRIRTEAKGEAQIRRVAALLAPDPRFERLSSFYFDRPTLFGSLVQGFGNENYGQVPESRVAVERNSLIGASGRFRLIQDRQSFTTEYGASVAYSKQSTSLISGMRRSIELSDDLRFDVTVRSRLGAGRKAGIFARAGYDTEFTPTIDPATGRRNARQSTLAGVLGLMRAGSPHLRALEVGGTAETDLARHTFVAGVSARAEFQAGRPGALNYRLRNDVAWFPYTGEPDPSVLSLRYNMVHEVLFPLFDELSLSVAADGFLFRGVMPDNRRPGFSMMLRVGLTYDRLWKPRYQPLF